MRRMMERLHAADHDVVIARLDSAIGDAIEPRDGAPNTKT